MEKELKKKVLVKVDEVVSLIKEDELYQEYLYLANKMKKNKEIEEKIASIKRYQKESVKEEVLGNTSKVQELDQKIECLLKELESFPLYVDFLRKQEELNEVFQLVKYRLQDYLEEKTNESKEISD